MYDRTTESLWSQSLGEAIVGELTGTRLDLLFLQVIEFGELKEKYDDALVLSTDTGHNRDYSRNPYSGYEDTERTYFPLTVQDKRFFAKDIFYVFWLDDDTSVAFPMDALKDERAETEIEGKQVIAERDGGEILVEVDGEPTPGYIEMWFSWVTQHQDDGVVWELGEE